MVCTGRHHTEREKPGRKAALSAAAGLEGIVAGCTGAGTAAAVAAGQQVLAGPASGRRRLGNRSFQQCR